MFQHPHGHKRIAFPGDVPVIVLHELHTLAQSELSGAPAGPENLLVGNMEGPNGHTVVLRHVQCQRAPTASGVHNALARVELQLAAYVIHFGDLRFFQRRGRRRKIGAGVDELRVEPEPVEIGFQIVMLVNIVAGAPQRVALEMRHELRHNSAVPAMVSYRYRLIQGFESGNEVSFDGDAAFAIGISKANLWIKHQFEERSAIPNVEISHRRGIRRRNFYAVSESETDRWTAYRAINLSKQPSIEIGISVPIRHGGNLHSENSCSAQGLRAASAFSMAVVTCGEYV